MTLWFNVWWAHLKRPLLSCLMLIPELDVAELGASLRFYIDVLEFRILFERPAERFAYLELTGSS